VEFVVNGEKPRLTASLIASNCDIKPCHHGKLQHHDVLEVHQGERKNLNIWKVLKRVEFSLSTAAQLGSK